VKHYLDQFKIDLKALSKLLKLHEQKILDDMLPQIEQRLQEEIRIGFKVSDEELGYVPYTKAVKASAETYDWGEVDDADARGNLITGYVKVFTQLMFLIPPKKSY
jgi:hypothetical protein